MGRSEKMTLVRDMRARQMVPQRAERSGLFGTIAFAIVAFAAGAGAIAVWKWMPLRNPPPGASVNSPVAATSDIAPTFPGNRLGRAGTAPLLRTCVKGDTFEGFRNPEAVYIVLTTAGTMSRLAPLVGAEMGDGVQLTEYWREIADCVYQQNSWQLCEPDNRALAVESASGFIRNAAGVAANPKTRDAQATLRENAAAKQRVLDSLRSRLRNGHLIAGDFGPLQPPEIKALLNETKPIANGCAKS